MVYNLSFYDSEKKSRDNEWVTSIYAVNDEEAIKQVEEKRKKRGVIPAQTTIASLRIPEKDPIDQPRRLTISASSAKFTRISVSAVQI